jgi:hypothetical protein
MKKAIMRLIILIWASISAAGANEWYIEQKIPPPKTATWPHAWAVPISISGDICIMGALVDGENGLRAGAAYVYRFDGSEWVEEQKLMALDGQEGDTFGYDVAINDGTIIIGASGDDDNGEDSGSAYVFRHNGTEWVQTQKLMPSNREYENHFGTCIRISGDICIIGAGSWYFDVPSQVYIFRFDGDSWKEEESITFSKNEAGDFWGKLDMFYLPFDYGDEAGFVVGAAGDDEAGENVGAVYLFRNSWANQSEWSMIKKIMPPDSTEGLLFGESVAYTGEVLAVSALGNGSQDSCIYMYRPSNYSFDYAPNGPLPEQKLTIPRQDKGKAFVFGTYLAVDRDTLITTAFRIIDDDPQHCDGIVYVYEYNGSVWVLKSRIVASDSRQDMFMFGQLFPWPVAIDGDVAMLGAQGSIGELGMTYIYRRCPTADVNGDCFVSLADFSVLAQEWLTGFHPWPRRW